MLKFRSEIPGEVLRKKFEKAEAGLGSCWWQSLGGFVVGGVVDELVAEPALLDGSERLRRGQGLEWTHKIPQFLMVNGFLVAAHRLLV